ncbi:hypothetical protein GQX74_013283 [Glossina fuscipes]|nr:hypothetical protein GQX74_013283 [Glossina fuscipes]
MHCWRDFNFLNTKATNQNHKINVNSNSEYSLTSKEELLDDRNDTSLSISEQACRVKNAHNKPEGVTKITVWHRVAPVRSARVSVPFLHLTETKRVGNSEGTLPSHSWIVIELTIKKGGKQPYSIKMGNNKLPDKEPKRPNIIDNDATEVLHKGKKKRIDLN